MRRSEPGPLQSRASRGQASARDGNPLPTRPGPAGSSAYARLPPPVGPVRPGVPPPAPDLLRLRVLLARQKNQAWAKSVKPPGPGWRLSIRFSPGTKRPQGLDPDPGAALLLRGRPGRYLFGLLGGFDAG